MTEFYDLNGIGDTADFGWTRSVIPRVVMKDILREARKNRQEEVVIAGGNDNANRLASDCWEVDMIGSPERHNERDFMHQMNSGIDYVIARACAEKGIAIEFRFANVLGSRGRKRAQVLARMAQNVRICRKAGCDMVITSGSRDNHGLRAPRDLIAFGIVIGMSLKEAKAAVSENPGRILKRSGDRKNPDIILKGLEVKKWASKPKAKKTYGWY